MLQNSKHNVRSGTEEAALLIHDLFVHTSYVYQVYGRELNAFALQFSINDISSFGFVTRYKLLTKESSSGILVSYLL